MMTPIQLLGDINGNKLYMKREDLIPYSFGGNKARKSIEFFKEIDKGAYDCVVTYGSSHSNHCRVVSNMAAVRNMRCILVSPKEAFDPTFNSKFMNLFGSEIITTSVDKVRETIEKTLQDLKREGYNPFFIPGGGHGNIGTNAYVQCYDEILAFENKNSIHFDYVFFASGTGTTHAGLVCGQLINKDDKKIIGISIARRNPYGRNVVIESIKDYLTEKNIEIDDECIQNITYFLDDYIETGYGKYNHKILNTIKEVLIKYGIPLDTTYTGKAFYGMQSYLKEKNIVEKNILFIHTGGTPLFFDDLLKF